MSSSHLPPTGSIKVVKPTKAAKLVEHIADDTENLALGDGEVDVVKGNERPAARLELDAQVFDRKNRLGHALLLIAAGD